MRGFLSIAVLAAVLSACSSHQSAPSVIEGSHDAAILNGQEVPLEHVTLLYSYVVGVDYSVETFDEATGVTTAQMGACTGTLIAKDIVLTAAHCIPKNGDVKNLYVHYGESFLNHFDQSKIQAKAFVLHEKYDFNDINRAVNDIAMIKLSAPLNSTFYKPMALPQTWMDYSFGSQVLSIGYGANLGKKEQPNGSGRLRMTTKPMKQVFIQKDRVYVDHSDGKGACFGDSGGPAIVTYRGQQSILGVASGTFSKLTPEQKKEAFEQGIGQNEYLDRHPEIEKCNLMSVYASVTYQMPWIVKTMATFNALQ